MTRHSTDITATRLAGLVGSRLCHDLISPIGAIANGLELLQLSGQVPDVSESAEVQLLSESVGAAKNRIEIFRIAFGPAESSRLIARAEAGKLIGNVSPQGKLHVEFTAEDDLAKSDLQMLLLALMCFETILPWGGEIRVSKDESCWQLSAKADRIRKEAGLWAWLGAEDTAPSATVTAANIHFVLLALAADDAGREIQCELGENHLTIGF